jgi:ribosome-associated protein
MPDLAIDATRSLPSESLSWKAARASGPGGQHVNRTESKIQLTFDPALVPWMDEHTKRRLATLAGRQVDSEGRVLISSQEHREQSRNLDAAFERLVALVKQALVRPKRRVATKPTKSSQRRRLQGKREQSEKKARRGKVERDD